MKFLRDFLTGTLIAAGIFALMGLIVLYFWYLILTFTHLTINPSVLNLVIFLIVACVGIGLYCAFKLSEYIEEDK